MGQGKDETKNKAEIQADAIKIELRYMSSTDFMVFRHSMTVLAEISKK